ncbi:toll-like receptor Tollo [Planococcus citri]|uniref:toll-like receptor Tollo n=1 Tax=Planococcus citri TaxID=170843 RepID=UPI0031F990B9
MHSGSAFFVAIVGTMLLIISGKSLRYQAPDECKWYSVTADGEQEVSANLPDDQEVALVCRLRTINSEIEKTNLSVIQPQYTVKLKIVCSEMFFFKSSVNPGSFQTLIDLKDLSLEFCKIGNVTAGAFRGLRQLRNLTFITHNDDWSGMSLEVYPNVFADDLHLLERLDFSCNNIRSLPEGVFCPLQNLHYLNLTRNKLTSVGNFMFNENNEVLKCGENLRVLDLSNNTIDSLPQKVFSRLSLLEELYLQDNAMTVIADHAFDNLSSLSVLNLANNKLVYLPPELFTDTRQIKEIHLQNNSITMLAPGLFNDLGKLLVLDLSQNQLTEEWINSATFSGLARLIVLNLSGNNITKLDAYMFRDLFQLQILRLENNAIHSIPGNTFASLYELTTLVLSNNKIKRIDGFTFASLSGLTLLALDNNQISYVDDEAFHNSTNMEDLHLNGNELADIPVALKNIPNLKTLDLGTNRISQILLTSFPVMNQLVGLRLTENNITEVRKGVFDQLTELQIINLSNNKIRKIDQGTFDANLKVVAIRIDGNYLIEVGGLFSKLPNLVWLNISENFLEWFDYALIPTGLQWLDIHGNKITELGNHFEIENQLQLSVFDASNNRLTEITGSSIPDNVQSLNLANNQISKIQSYAFFKKYNLTKVDLVGNQLKILTPHSLRISSVPAGRTLPEFYVADNPFQCDCTMQWLQSYSVEPERNRPILADLNEVKCELLYNRENSVVPLKEATADQFLCRYELECAKRSMCDCCDFDACDCKVVCPANCTCYHSMSANANVVSCSKSGYHGSIPEKIPMNVTQLYLDGNDIRVLSSHSFIGRKLLKVIFLNNSNIEVIYNRTFHGLKELEILRLENNRITSLKGNEFEGLDKLKELYLHNNRISMIQSNVLITPYALSTLRLDQNHLTQFSIWKLPSSLNTVTLADNPWTCECQFVQKVQEYLQYLKNTIVDSKEMKCYNHSYKFSFPIMSDNITSFCVQEASQLSNITSNIIEGALNGNLSSNESDSKQNLHHFLPITVIAISLLFFFGIIAIVVCMYKDELRIWFYSKFGVRLFYPTSEIEMDDRDKLFDAFVSYSAKDEIFVAEELAPILENGDPPYKLCLHYREFPIGGYLSDTIVQAVESSRRTIMVLSENFIKSEWSRYEFKSAHHQVLRDRRKRLIVILLGEVPFKDLDADLRLFLKHNTYLQWGEKLFWERLRFALPDVPNNQRLKNNRHRHVHINSHNHHHHSLHRHHNRNNTSNSRSVAIHI